MPSSGDGTITQIQIDIISDTVCPWCYIGKRRLEKAMEQRPDTTFTVNWHPYQLNPDMPEGGLPRAEYLDAKFGGGEKAKTVYRRIESAGKSEDITFDFVNMERSPNTVSSHRLILWSGSAGVQDGVVERLFEAYFEDGKDIGDTEVLVEVAQESGMDAKLVRDLFAKGADVDSVKKQDLSARQSGVTGVPCFIIANKYVVVGAQDPDALIQVFDTVMAEAQSGPAEVAEVPEVIEGETCDPVTGSCDTPDS